MTKCFTDSSVPLLNELVLISIYRGIESTIYNDGNLIQYITVIGRSGAFGSGGSAVSMETDSNRLKILFLFIVILLVFRRKIRAPMARRGFILLVFRRKIRTPMARRGFILLVLKIHLSIANGLPP